MGLSMDCPQLSQQPRMHTICAAICQHPIRFSSILPKSASKVDLDVPYCSACLARWQHTLHSPSDDSDHEHMSQLSALQQVMQWNSDRDIYRRSTSGKAQEPSSVTDDAAKSSREDDPSWYKLTLRRSRARSVHFDQLQVHRDEDEYRECGCYDRSLPEYRPGRWADETGEGYINTSDPYQENPELDEGASEEDSEDEEHKNEELGSGGEEDDDEDDMKYATLSNEELAVIQEVIKANLAKFEKQAKEIEQQEQELAEQQADNQELTEQEIVEQEVQEPEQVKQANRVET